MPPKKKRRVSQAHPCLGVGRQHLSAMYGTLPTTVEGLKKGHVVQLFHNLDGSRANVVRHLMSAFPSENFSSGKLSDRIKLAVNKMQSCSKKLKDAKEFEKYSALCEERFEIPTASSDAPTTPQQPTTPIARPSTSSDVTPSTSSNHPSAIATPSTRSKMLPDTPVKAKLRKQLSFTSSSCKSLRDRLKEARQKCRTKCRDKMKDTVKAQKIEIERLTELLESVTVFKELAEFRITYKKLLASHKKMRQSEGRTCKALQ